jgi:hypothetical protein
MGKDPAHNVGRGLHPPSYISLDSARHAKCFAWLLQKKNSGHLNDVRTRETAVTQRDVRPKTYCSPLLAAK